MGAASSYDFRYSTSPITDTSFAAATQVAGEPVPEAFGSSESFTIDVCKTYCMGGLNGPQLETGRRAKLRSLDKN